MGIQLAADMSCVIDMKNSEPLVAASLRDDAVDV